LTNQQFSKIVEIVDDNKSLFNFIEINKLDKAISLVIFIIKDIYNYVTDKTSDGVLIIHLKKRQWELTKLNLKISKLILAAVLTLIYCL